MQFSAKVGSYQNNITLNICDTELLGKKLVQDELTMNISENYYGEKVTYPIRPCFFTYDTFFFVRCRQYQPSIECAISFAPRIVRVLKNYQSTIDEMIVNFKKYSKGKSKYKQSTNVRV